LWYSVNSKQDSMVERASCRVLATKRDSNLQGLIKLRSDTFSVA
jgi:hypothetical protein